VNGIYVIKCPTTSNPGIAKNARKTIYLIHAKQKKQQHNLKECKNFATTNYADFDNEGKEYIQQQVHQAVSITSDAASINFSIIGVIGGTSSATADSGSGHWKKPFVFPYNVQVLQTKTHCPVLTAAIQSVMPHTTLQLSLTLNDSNGPIIRCVVNTPAALWIWNYHFFAGVTKRYLRCVAKILFPEPEDSSSTILSGIIQDDEKAITTDLPMAFQFHLPYFTKDGS
jgi:hypothetical protein